MRINNVIKRPLLTEKSTIQVGHNWYAFEVANEVTKAAISGAVKDLFGVDVLSVRTSVMPGKQKRILNLRKFAKLPKWKKAVVKIKDGQKISLFEIKEEKK